MSREITLAQLIDWLVRYADKIDEQARYLTELDAAIGDADHGANMVRGMGSVRARLQDPAEPFNDVGTLFRTVAMTLISSVGGAAGPLYGAFFMRAAKEPNGSSGASITVAQLAQMFRAGLSGLQQRGKAEIEEKTMLDALEPAVDALEQAAANGATVGEALAAARDAAERGMAHTVEIEATKGRASYLGPRSIGHQDPGATSSYYLIETLAGVMEDEAA